MNNSRNIRSLYSFPNKLGGDRICYTAWQQVNGLAAAGASVTVAAASIVRPLPTGVASRPTLSRGSIRVPFKALGKRRALTLHDRIVAHRLPGLKDEIDVIHTWPSGALRTLEAAKKLGIPSTLERCNAHTRYGYEVVRSECDRLGVKLPASDESAWNDETLANEEEEFRLADRLLCPSDFVLKTFLEKGFAPEKLVRHSYGVDIAAFHPATEYQPNRGGLKMLFVGSCTVRKGVHFALEAWLKSSAHKTGTFTIAGNFFPEYEEKLKPMLNHPSVCALGHRSDVPQLMQSHDILILPSLEEGFPLVCMEAFGSGCVPVVSEVCAGVCEHERNAMMHRIGDVDAITAHITRLDQDREFLQNLRSAGLKKRNELTWTVAGKKLYEAYQSTIEAART
jgi:glycosyltransferase involved in cell wall biosynthesis